MDLLSAFTISGFPISRSWRSSTPPLISLTDPMAAAIELPRHSPDASRNRNMHIKPERNIRCSALLDLIDACSPGGMQHASLASDSRGQITNNYNIFYQENRLLHHLCIQICPGKST